MARATAQSGNRGAAAACYVPVPGLAWLVARSLPQDRLVRHHARQGLTVTLLAWGLLLAAGLVMGLPGMAEVATVAAGTVLGLTLLALLVGAVGALRGRFTRIRGAWDLVARPKPKPSR